MARLGANDHRERSARTLRNFRLKVGMVGKFEARILELVENIPDLVAVLVEPRLTGA